MKTRNYILSGMFLTFLIATVSCKKLVDVSAPKNQLVNSKVFADSTDANSAIIGIYLDMMQSVGFSISNGGLTLYPGLSADELSQTAKDADMTAIYSNQINLNNKYNAGLWSSAYKFIYDANACIEGIQNSSSIPSTTKPPLIAEAKQIRAFIYFNLINLYGSTPLVKSTEYHINDALPRTPIDSVYAQILADASFAQSNLTTNGVAQRASYYSATALLAKVQLYLKNYNAAESEATKIINSGKYQLEPDINNVFLANSNESIWKMIPVFPGVETWEGYNFVPSTKTAAPKYTLTNSLYNSFETGDLRITNWISSNTIAGTVFPYPFKYKKSRTTGDPTENYVIFRLAEQYLIRAEARANLNNFSGALADLNAIRHRAGLPNTTAFDQSSILAAIIKERRSELFCEWGNRWFDLKRLNLTNTVLSPIKTTWSPDDALYPIPQNELLRNPALVQNPGY